MLLCLCLTGCVSNGKTGKEHTKIVDRITAKYVRKARDEGFVISATGGGMMGDIRHIRLELDTVANLEIPQVREIIVRKEEELLDMLNADREVRPYLHVYPCGIEIFRLGIGFSDPAGSFAELPYIAYATVLVGRVNYSIFDQDKRRLDKVYDEPYEEAYRIVFGKEREL
jgi:hypothetical protein